MCIMTQHCSINQTKHSFEAVLNGRHLYFWKLERSIDTPEPPGKKSSTFKLFRVDVSDKKKGKKGHGHGHDHGHDHGHSHGHAHGSEVNIFEPAQVLEQPVEIESRRMVIEDDDDKFALRIGFVRNQTQNFYTDYDESQLPTEEQFLNDQIITVKYSQTNLNTYMQGMNQNQVLVQMYHLLDFTIGQAKEITQYAFRLNESYSFVRAR